MYVYNGMWGGVGAMVKAIKGREGDRNIAPSSR
jgi:hypothetical protein